MVDFVVYGRSDCMTMFDLMRVVTFLKHYYVEHLSTVKLLVVLYVVEEINFTNINLKHLNKIVQMK